MAASAQSELVRRQIATSATMDRYRNRSFDWRNSVTCVHLARFHLRQMGHTPEPLPSRVRSLIGAKRALAERGWKSTLDMLDAQPGLSRIAPAMMWLGDLAVLESEEGLGAIFVCAGPQKLIGWLEASNSMLVVDVPLIHVDGAWRV